MGPAFMRKYGVLTVTGTTAIRIPLIKRGVVDFAVGADYTPSAGDVKVAIDGAAPTNVVNLPVAVASGNGAYWEYIPTAAELTCKQAIYTTVDAATKAIEDQCFIIETFGHASAMYQVDLSAANLTVDLQTVKGQSVTCAAGVTVNSNVGTTQPVNFTGTGATAYVKAGLWEILGTVLTETSGQIAAAFKKVFDVAAATFTALSVNQTGDSYPRIGAPAGGSVSADIAALLTAVNNLNNLSALANMYGPQVLEIPDSSTTLFPFTLTVRDEEGHLVDVDTNAVTLAAVNGAGTDRSANFSIVTHAGTGVYTFTYSVSSAAAEEGLHLSATAAVSSSARRADFGCAVANYDSITTLAAIKAKTDNLPASPAAVGSAMTLTGAYDAAKTAAQAGNQMDLVNAPNATAVTAIQNGLATHADATTIEGRLPAALSSNGNMKADIEELAGNTGGAARLDRSARAIGIGTVGTGSTTTSIVTSSLLPACTTASGQFNGRVLIFDKDTTTANLRGQPTTISAATTGGVLTVVALTDAAVSGDTFTIT